MMKKIVNLKAFFSISRNIEEHKPTPTQRKAQQEGIMAKKILLQKYQILKCEPTDNLDKISNNYIQLKKLYNNRRYYIPDKKDYLIMLDQCYNDILKVHEDYNYLELGKETGLVNKKQTIVYELKAIRTAEYIALLQTYEAAGLILFFIVLLLILGQESDSESEKVKIFQMFSLTSRLKQRIDNFHQNRLNSYMEKQKKQIASAEILKKYEEIGIEYDPKKHGIENVAQIKKRAEEKLGIKAEGQKK